MVPFVTSEVQTADVLPHCLKHKTLYGILQNTQRRCYTAFSNSKPYKNAETQTDYRESEAQTEPWEPPCKIVPGNNYIAVIIILQYTVSDSYRIHSQSRKQKKQKLEILK